MMPFPIPDGPAFLAVFVVAFIAGAAIGAVLVWIF